MYTEIKEALIESGVSEETACRLAEFIDDCGWDTVRDVLNTL